MDWCKSVSIRSSEKNTIGGVQNLNIMSWIVEILSPKLHNTYFWLNNELHYLHNDTYFSANDTYFFVRHKPLIFKLLCRGHFVDLCAICASVLTTQKPKRVCRIASTHPLSIYISQLLFSYLIHYSSAPLLMFSIKRRSRSSLSTPVVPLAFNWL